MAVYHYRLCVEPHANFIKSTRRCQQFGDNPNVIGKPRRPVLAAAGYGVKIPM
jgi:hypothetical protein